ncbi:MAG: Gfo/Idh/MocA family oxidoreductase, partial [Naasia sp.]
MTSDSPSSASPVESRLRAAIIGAGMIAEVHRRSILLSGAELVGVLGSRPERSAEVGAAWGVRGYDDLDALLADSVDVVHICTPNATHAFYAEAALRAGIHVVCEKPLGVDVAEARRLADLAAETGLVATVPFVYRYHPLVREIRARREAGEFGEWNLLHGTYLQDWLLAPGSSSWRVDPAAGGASRAFADIGSHWCDLVEWVSGERFASLTARLSIAMADRPAPSGHAFSGGGDADAARVPVTTEDSAVVMLETESGVIGNVVISQLSAGRKNRL